MIDFPPLDPGIEIIVATRGMSKGIAQTDGPQLVARPFVQLGLLRVGGQWKNLTSPVAGGEGLAFVSVAPKIGEFQLGFGASRKFLTGVTAPTDDKSWEFTGGASRKFGKLGVRASVIYSPDDLGGAKRSVHAEVSPTYDIGKTTQLMVGIGRRERVNGDDYTAYVAGIGKTFFKRVTVDARYHGSNRAELGDFYEDRLVISAKMSL